MLLKTSGTNSMLFRTIGLYNTLFEKRCNFVGKRNRKKCWIATDFLLIFNSLFNSIDPTEFGNSSFMILSYTQFLLI